MLFISSTFIYAFLHSSWISALGGLVSSSTKQSTHAIATIATSAIRQTFLTTISHKFLQCTS